MSTASPSSRPRRNQRPLGFYALLTVVAVGLALIAAKQWRRSLLLRQEVSALRLETADQARLTAEIQRLRARQLPAPDLEALRAQRANVERLRAELERVRSAGPGAGR